MISLITNFIKKYFVTRKEIKDYLKKKPNDFYEELNSMLDRDWVDIDKFNEISETTAVMSSNLYPKVAKWDARKNKSDIYYGLYSVLDGIRLVDKKFKIWND